MKQAQHVAYQLRYLFGEQYFSAGYTKQLKFYIKWTAQNIIYILEKKVLKVSWQFCEWKNRSSNR